MRPIGFSTGALAMADFRRGLQLMQARDTTALELSALRYAELEVLVDWLPRLDLRQFRFVSIHAPSSYTAHQERDVVFNLQVVAKMNLHIVVHPDTIVDYKAWRAFGDLVCIENMDKRKALGRSVEELDRVFDKLPDASMCFDIAHARQYDTSMLEAYRILRSYRDKIRLLHISEVNSSSRHDHLSLGAIRSFQEVADLIPPEAPAIIESPVTEELIDHELHMVRIALRMSPSSQDIKTSLDPSISTR
jgi:hypothetical protein